jgi:hypothetical protein
MRKLKIIEHISLDGVIQMTSSPEDDFPYGDWTAPYRSPAGAQIVNEMYGKTSDLLVGRRTYDLLASFWPKAPKESDGGPPECGDEVRRNSQTGESGMGSIRGHWIGPRR